MDSDHLAPIEPKVKRVCVLAGTYHQFQDWLRENHKTNRDAFYADIPEDTYGMRYEAVIVVGTFWDRRDATWLHDLACRRATTN